jgi:RNA polymerase sigma-70 factor (ECF subfamily)
MDDHPALLGADAASRLGAEVTDEALVLHVGSGDPRWCEVFVRRYNTRLFRVARAIVKDDMLAEDVMQETYLRAFRCLHQFEGRSSLATWLTRIAVHEAIARQRKLSREATAEDLDDVLARDIQSAAIDPETALQRAEIGRVLTELVDGLPEPLRLVFVLRAVEGMTGGEVAEALGLSEENVKVRLFRARAALRRALDAASDVQHELFSFHLARCDRVVLGVLGRSAPSRPPPVDAPDLPARAT